MHLHHAMSDPGAPYPPSTGPLPPTGERPGELVDRFVARLIDLVLVGVVNAVVVGTLVVGILFSSGGDGLSALTGGGGGVAGLVSSLLSAALSLAYFSLMESKRGQTVGKMIMKLHVRSESGGLPTLEQAAKRNIWVVVGLVGIVPFVGGLLSFVGWVAAVVTIAVGINNDPVRRQPWTDKLGSTQVVKTG